jgi:hypothetical protein
MVRRAGWFDYDGRWLDLLVTITSVVTQNNIWCGERQRLPFLLPSRKLQRTKTKLYHNNHDGTFTDVSDASGVGKPDQRAWAWSWPTSTTTAGPTSPSPTTLAQFSIYQQTQWNL